MSWNDVIIGKGDKSTSSLTITYLQKISLSQNQTSFWADNIIFGLGATICKDTPEGKELELLIGEKAPEEYVTRKIGQWIIGRMKEDAESLIFMIEKEKRKSFKEGRESKAKEIREALEGE